ncbi:aldehyde dehydrogenase family protein [Microvirga lotononidis]|uniref:aldehyde dehydrogenase family protein n=1 Tax=Microvirga lotononidis TaxID=864069 RepID=UPI0009FF8F0C
MLNSRDVHAVVFTGSVDRASARLVPPLNTTPGSSSRWGGKNPSIALDRAGLGVALEASVNSAFFSAVRHCTARSRSIVTDGIQDRFVAAMIEGLKAWWWTTCQRLARTSAGDRRDPAEAGHQLHRDRPQGRRQVRLWRRGHRTRGPGF